MIVSMNSTQKFAEYIVNSSFEMLDMATIQRVKIRIADSIGVLIGGANGPGNEAIKDLLLEWEGKQEATILVHGGKVPMHNAAFINSLMLRSFDFEAIDAEAIGGRTYPAHITGTTVPVMLACGEHLKASGKDLVTALAVGDDLVARLVSASGFDVHDCYDNTGTANCLGAVAVAGKLLNLEPRQLVDAFGLGLNMCGGTMENVFEATWAFKLPIALSARNGIIAAQIAKRDLRGVADPISGTRGFFDMFSKAPDYSQLFIDIGKVFFGDTVIKPWSACRGTHCSIEATIEATGGAKYEPDEIESIVIKVSPHTKSFVGQDFTFGTTITAAGAFSIRFTVATAILYGGVRPEHYTAERMTDLKLKMMLNKLEVLDCNIGRSSIVEICLVDGTMLVGEVQPPALGNIFEKPLSNEQIFEKMICNVKYSNTISLKNAEKAFSLVLDLEELETIEPLIALLHK